MARLSVFTRSTRPSTTPELQGRVQAGSHCVEDLAEEAGEALHRRSGGGLPSSRQKVRWSASLLDVQQVGVCRIDGADEDP